MIRVVGRDRLVMENRMPLLQRIVSLLVAVQQPRLLTLGFCDKSRQFDDVISKSMKTAAYKAAKTFCFCWRFQ